MERDDQKGLYGSFRPGNTGRENQAVRAERGRMEVLEMADERKTIRRYLVIGLIIMAIVGLACYDLWMRVEGQFYSHGLSASGMPKVGKASGGGGILGAMFPPPSKRGPSSAGPAGGGTSERMPVSAQTSQRHLLLKHLMLDPSIMEAQSLLWKQIELWARLHPATAVHNGMVLVLHTDAQKYDALINAQVYHKLVDVQSCDAKHVCTDNPIATNVRTHVCPQHASCPPDVQEEIEQTAHWAAAQAVQSAFATLRASIFGDKSDALTQPALDRHGNLVKTSPADEGVVAQPAAFEKAAASGMGLQPAGFVPPSASWS